MDALTHIAIGACMGEALAGKKLGRKAMLWGAVAQSLPDIDAVAVFWMDTPDSLLAHRGITHSFLAATLVIPMLAALAGRWHRQRRIPMRRWLLFFAIAVYGHPLLDVFNNYGVGWLEPFSDQRFSLNALYVADPFFTIGPLIAAIALILLPQNHPKRRFWWRFGFIAAGVYLLLSILFKWKIDADTRQQLERQHLAHTRYFTTPAPLQNCLWFVVAGDDRGYYTGYRSLFDGGEDLPLTFFPRNDSLLRSATDQSTVRRLERFSQQFYTVEKWSDTLVFNDLRFGQEVGWEHPQEPFAFHYYLNYPDDNRLVVQRGRFAQWDWDATAVLLRKMAGE